MQRGIEMQGVPTVLITVEADESRQARPPRALAPMGFRVGYSLGRPSDPALHKWILSDALHLLTHPAPPGVVVERDYG
ncbi:MAG: hypothetical protein HY698_21700 [Deltaproteobacteria bacterium]|nr:hypothetical protein [Deltaproteobacteria bacterium]